MYRSRKQENSKFGLAAVWLALICASCTAVVIAATSDEKAFVSETEIARIIQMQSFEVINNVKDIPPADLISAGVINTKDGLQSFIVNPGEEFQRNDSWVDVKKPARQLILAAVNAKYELLCFWKATQGGPARYLILVRRSGTQSRVAFYATLDGEVREWRDIKHLVLKGEITPLISAEHPHPYSG